MAKKRDYTTLYKGHEGQWAWVAHRVTGLAVIFFLLAHILDTAAMGWGPHAYDSIMRIYENVPVRLLELGLVSCVVYHALNGIRIMLIDFWPKLADRQKQLFYGMLALFVIAEIPMSIIMIHQALNLLKH